jgi:hypothetical protein
MYGAVRTFPFVVYEFDRNYIPLIGVGPSLRMGRSIEWMMMMMMMMMMMAAEMDELRDTKLI